MPPCAMRPCLYLCLLRLLSWALATHAASTQPVRFWLDDAYFSPAETFFLRTEIAKSQGRLSISGELNTRAPLAINGAGALDKWDVYFTTRANCYRSLPWVQWPRRVNCLPGAESITLKKALVFSLQAAYGDDAFTLMPRSYLMPEQLGVWQAWSDEVQAPLDETWVLKANIHRGKGVHLHDLASAQDHVHNSVTYHSKRPAKSKIQPAANAPPSYVLAQQYIQNQFVYAGRQSYIRVWAVVTSVTPLRVYMYQGGVVIFGNKPVNSTNSKEGTENGLSGGNQQGPGQVVNLWQLERGQSLTWSLAELRAHITQAVYAENQKVLMQQQMARLKQEQKAAADMLGRRLQGLHDTPHATSHLDDAAVPSVHGDMADLRHRTHGGVDSMFSMQGQGPAWDLQGQEGEGDVHEQASAQSRNETQQAQQRRSLLQDPIRTRRQWRRRRRPSTPRLASPEQRFRRMWKQMHRAVGLAVAAGLPHMREAEKNKDHLTGPEGWITGAWAVQPDGAGGLGPKLVQPDGFNTQQVDDFWRHAPFQSGGNLDAQRQHVYLARSAGYEVLGADFLLDSDFNPKLVEINALPSSAPERTCDTRQACDEAIQKYVTSEVRAASEAEGPRLPATALPAEEDGHMLRETDSSLPHSSFDKQKHGLVHDLLGLLGLPVHPNGPSQTVPEEVNEDLDGGSNSNSNNRRLLEEGVMGVANGEGQEEARRVLAQQSFQHQIPASTKYRVWAERAVNIIDEHDHQQGSRQQWAPIGDVPLHSGEYGPASKHPGLGATLVLVAALLGQSVPAGSPAASTAASEAVINNFGSMYPAAMQAAEKAASAVHALMCPGLDQLPHDLVSKGSTVATAALTAVDHRTRDDLDDATHETCVKSCFYLDELQVVGEQELEMSSRGAFQRLAPLKEAILRNKVALMVTRGGDAAKQQRLRPGWMTSLSSWLSSLGSHWIWSDDGHQVLASHVIETATPLDEVTQAAIHARMAMVNDGSLLKCTRDPDTASACAVQMLRRMLNDWCTAKSHGVDHGAHV